MSLLDIIQSPHPILRTIAEPITEFGPELERLSMDMLETMYTAEGIGLAAPQVGLSIRLIVADIEDGYDARVLVNPEIVWRAGTMEMEEGCLSLPGQSARVGRSQKVSVRYKDSQGEEHESDLEGILAVVIQHEIDHLDGILMIDER